ncbi:MAG: hypothetical protein H6741_18910 [Alphaproteobacteria bacterium]|nr:hypothetical protein [Alphaproteobacteria bacterium]MCB9794781.1 hypothetical protein [Alphaproteobacteria bacterium]
MIYPFSFENQRLWSRGELQVQLMRPGETRPLGWCDGTEEDEAELLAIAESEDLDELPISKRVLKTGREIWTVGAPPKDDGLWQDD